MGDVVESLKEVSAAVAAQAQSRQGDAAGSASSAAAGGGGGGASLDSAEAAWRETGDGAKWLECLDDADVAGAAIEGQHLGPLLVRRDCACVCCALLATSAPATAAAVANAYALLEAC